MTADEGQMVKNCDLKNKIIIVTISVKVNAISN